MLAKILLGIAVCALMLVFSNQAFRGRDERADAERGQQLFTRRCSGCHALDLNKEGPQLRGVYGRKSASVPGFEYSAALRKTGITWDRSSLEEWLTDPEVMVPETDMNFRLKDGDERKAVIAYLKSLGSE